MPLLESSVVSSTAITDLINAAIFLIVFFCLRHVLPAERAESRYWQRLMLMASVSSLLGYVTHIYPWGYVMIALFWLVLCVTILETAHNFFMLSVSTISNGTRPSEKQLRCLRLCEIAAVVILLVVILLRRHPIQLLIVFAVLLVIPGLCFFARLAIRGHRGSRILLCFLLPLIPCLVLQLMGLHEEVVFGSLNVDGLCHLFIMLDIPIVYVAARKWDK